MKKIIDYFIDNTLIVNLLTVLILVLGFYSMFNLNKETFPLVEFNFITITTNYPGAAAEEVESLVSLPIERILKGIDGVDELNSLSLESISIISLKIDPDVDTDEVYDEVRNSLSGVSSEIPEDAKTPILKKAANKNRSILDVAIWGLEEKELRSISKILQKELENDQRIVKVELSNYRDEYVAIDIDLLKMNQLDLSLSEVLTAVKDGDINVSGGNIISGDREKLIRTIRESNKVEQIEKTVIRSNDSGESVLLKDIGKVRRTLKERVTHHRNDGETALFLKIYSKSKSDIILTADFVKEKVKSKSEQYNFSFKESQDLSFYVKRRLSILSFNGIQGIVLVTICLIFFMNFRVSIITALGAPFAFLVAFSLMSSFGITINLISMFGLILVLGMLVDDSIIVSEQYYQNLEEGLEPKDAAKKAAIETIAPVTSTILTTIVAFSSLFFMDGIMGKFLWPVPAVIIICLIASWLECFFILPGHLVDFASNLKGLKKVRWYEPLIVKYKKILGIALKYAKSTIILFFGVFILSLVVAKSMRFELFPSDDATYVYVNLKGPVGTPLEITNNKLLEIEKIIFNELKKDEYKGIRAITGLTWERDSGTKKGSHYGSLFIEFTMQDLRERKTNELVKLINDKIQDNRGEFEINVDKIKNGPPGGKPISIDFFGEDFDKMKLAAGDIKDHILKKEGVLSSTIQFEEGKEQVILKINESEARRLGVSNIQIAKEVRNSFEGLVARTIKESEEDIDVLVRLNENYRESQETLDKIRISNKFGQKVSLRSLVKIERQTGLFVVRRLNGQRVLTLNAEVDPQVLTARKLNSELESEIPRIMKKHPEATYEIKGENKDTKDSMYSFKRALILSSFIIFIILVIQFSSLFQPLIIMLTIPLGFIGVIIAFKTFNLAMGFMALMGVLGLVGVVVNDSIVLVSVLNKSLLKHGRSQLAIIHAAASRFRPVILTTFTTVVGLLPIAHTPGGDPFLKPMAISFAYGLLFSTLLTLFFVPCCYGVYVQFTNKKLARK